MFNVSFYTLLKSVYHIFDLNNNNNNNNNM